MTGMKGKLFLGRYEVQRQLGEGGMGRVYLARQLDLQRHVVVKVMHEHLAADPQFHERFEREMLLMARFQHPYSVALYDASLNDPAGPCLVMEYIRGVTLEELLLRSHRLSPGRVGRILGQVCEVLQAAHGAGFMHRDLKPANIMIQDADSGYEKVKVMDFGLAKLLDPRSIKRLDANSDQFAIGTPAYMSPEQVRGDEMDHRSDLYSLGIILYETLTGRVPFDGTSTMEVLLAHTKEPPRDMADSDVWVPPAVESVVRKCLAKDPAERPASARELNELYQQALEAGDEAPAPAGEVPEEPAATEVAEPQASAQPIIPDDPAAVVFQLQAWMPEHVAAYKLRGFIEDMGGQLVESVPGRIRVHLGGRGSTYHVPRGRLAWLGIGTGHSIELNLHMQHQQTDKQNELRLTAVFRFLGRSLVANWRNVCTQIFCDLRAYLVGASGTVAS